MTALALPDQRDERASPVPGGYLVARSPEARSGFEVCRGLWLLYRGVRWRRVVDFVRRDLRKRAADTPRVCESFSPTFEARLVRDRPGDEPKAFNGRNTQTFGLPGLRPVAPSLRSGYGRPPHGGRWCAARTVTRATLGTCSVLERRPREATSKAQAVGLALPDRPAAEPALRSLGLRQRTAKACPDGHVVTPAKRHRRPSRPPPLAPGEQRPAPRT